jgi:ferredoxin
MTSVNKEKCIGCGLCASVCSEGFEIQDGKAQVKDPSAKCAKEAAEQCPVDAISA